MIKVEEGKFYKTRDGRKARVMRNTIGSGIFSVFEGHVFLGNVFEGTGTANMPLANRPRPHDLIEEWKEEKKMVFEVGKKYTRASNVGYECVFAQSVTNSRDVGVGIAVFKDPKNGYLFHVDEEYWWKWKEYVEPKTYSEEYFVKLSPQDFWLTTVHSQECYIKGKIRVTYTEGSGIAVEVLKGDDTI